MTGTHGNPGSYSSRTTAASSANGCKPLIFHGGHGLCERWSPGEARRKARNHGRLQKSTQSRQGTFLVTLGASAAGCEEVGIQPQGGDRDMKADRGLRGRAAPLPGFRRSRSVSWEVVHGDMTALSDVRAKLDGLEELLMNAQQEHTTRGQLGGLASLIKRDNEARHAWAATAMRAAHDLLLNLAHGINEAVGITERTDTKHRWARLSVAMSGTAAYAAPAPFTIEVGLPPGRQATMELRVSTFGDVVMTTTFPDSSSTPAVAFAQASTSVDLVRDVVAKALREMLEELRRPGHAGDYTAHPVRGGAR